MILDFLFPNRCLECNTIIQNELIICARCYSQIKFSHWNINKDNLLYKKANLLFPLESAYSLMIFEKEGFSQRIIHQLKYKKMEKIGNILASWICDKIQWTNNLPDMLIPVPLHPKKEKERGYNQLSIFTKKLSEQTKIPYFDKYLIRNKYQKPQSKKGKVQRNNTENIFSLTKEINNKHILLLDDVFTTGNTLSSIAWKFIEKENKISILVMATAL